MGILRIINSRKLNHALGDRAEQTFRRCKEQIGLGNTELSIAVSHGSSVSRVSTELSLSSNYNSVLAKSDLFFATAECLLSAITQRMI